VALAAGAPQLICPGALWEVSTGTTLWEARHGRPQRIAFAAVMVLLCCRETEKAKKCRVSPGSRESFWGFSEVWESLICGPTPGKHLPCS